MSRAFCCVEHQEKRPILPAVPSTDSSEKPLSKPKKAKERVAIKSPVNTGLFMAK
jgi:hypothetical protein